jgi:hypothetical protein
MKTLFTKLNENWNADPNSPVPIVEIHEKYILLTFAMNPYGNQQFKVGDVGKITFYNCSKYRLGATNDEGWYRGQCRFSKIAPAWGEFYKVSGNLKLADCPADWVEVGQESEGLSHFLFYFRDNTFECNARDWKLEIGTEDNPRN